MKRRNIVVFILSLILSICTVIGISFQFYSSLELIRRKPFMTVSLFLITFIILWKGILYFFLRLDNYVVKKENIKKGRLFSLFQQRPLLFSFVTILVGWSIYVIAFYPAIMSFDPSFQILQYFGIDNKYSYYSVLLDNHMIITNHHPIVHTLLLGFCVKVGLIFGSTNSGLFFYTMLQLTILAFTLSYTIHFMKEINISSKYQLLCLGIYTLVPVFPFYAMTPLKDTIFCSFIILYIITIFNYLHQNKYSFIKMLFLSIFIILFRNNGFHLLLLSFPFLFLVKNKKRIFVGLNFIFFVGFYFSYHHIVLPYFKVTPSSPREVLSIPFQQTARYVSLYDNEVTKEEKEAIDKILGYSTLKYRYQPENADPVKNEFNKYSTREDMQQYFKVWYQQLRKHPGTYLEATLNNTYGYFYPLKRNWYLYTKYNKVLKENHFDYHFNELSHLRMILTVYGNIFPYLPFLGLFVNIGFSTWILFFLIFYFIDRKKYKEILPFLPSILILLVCIASPVNTYFRYILPNIFAMPTLFAIFIFSIQKKLS